MRPSSKYLRLGLQLSARKLQLHVPSGSGLPSLRPRSPSIHLMIRELGRNTFSPQILTPQYRLKHSRGVVKFKLTENISPHYINCYNAIGLVDWCSIFILSFAVKMFYCKSSWCMDDPVHSCKDRIDVQGQPRSWLIWLLATFLNFKPPSSKTKDETNCPWKPCMTALQTSKCLLYKPRFGGSPVPARQRT